MTALAKKLLFGIVGGVVILIGLILVPLPGPGILIIAGGIAILARQFLWAKRLETRCREYIRRRGAKAGGPAPPPEECKPMASSTARHRG